MTPIEPPNPPRKASWKWWVVAAACVAAIALAVLFLKRPGPKPVSIWYAGSTNDNGVKKLVFQGTNGTAGRIWYEAYVTTNLKASSHPEKWPDPYNLPGIGQAGAKGSFTIYLVAPPKELAWRVLWTSDGIPRNLTPWKQRRVQCARFMSAHGMGALAGRISPRPALHYIPASEIKE